MRFRKLESRIKLLFLLLILVVQMAGFALIRTSIERNARTSINSELEHGSRLFTRLLEQNAQKLIDGAHLLASDYGFRQAIGTDDRETIASALANQSERIGASLALLVSPTGEIKATSMGSNAPGLQKMAQQLANEAVGKGSAKAVAIVESVPYQAVVVPVKAPTIIGWVVMAFPLDRKLAADMLQLTSLEVTVLSRAADEKWKVNLTSLDSKQSGVVASTLEKMPVFSGRMHDMTIDDAGYRTLTSQLARQYGQETIFVLQRSVTEAIAPYRSLQWSLLILTALGIIVAAVGSAFTARRIADPLRELAQSVGQLSEGDYTRSITVKRDDEIGELARAFEKMRIAIARRELEISRLAYWDPLTNLPNRAQFTKLLSAAIRDAGDRDIDCHVLMMDLDRFKNVNDILGHSFGDALLRHVADRLCELIPAAQSKIARLGGDEFSVLLPASTTLEAKALAADILKALEVPISLDGQTVDLGAGIGIAAYPAHGGDAESLLSRAEVAMYVAKQTGNEFVVYDPSIDDASEDSLSLMSELRRAIDQKEFRFHVQPKIDLSTGKLIGMEALVRWMHPVRGMVPPDRFIPFAEKTGFIRLVTAWMLEQAALVQQGWLAQGIHLKISVNLSTRDLLDQELPTKFASILAQRGVPANLFCLEITESAIMDDPVRSLNTLDRLNQMGVELSIDDFGTGYSSLAYLKRLPVHELKIDKSFVLSLEKESDDVAIVRSTIDLGHNMGLRVVAEGVENKAVWNLLNSMGCDQAQGFYISRPIAVELLPNWISTWEAQHEVPDHFFA